MLIKIHTLIFTSKSKHKTVNLLLHLQ